MQYNRIQYNTIQYNTIEQKAGRAVRRSTLQESSLRFATSTHDKTCICCGLPKSLSSRLSLMIFGFFFPRLLSAFPETIARLRCRFGDSGGATSEDSVEGILQLSSLLLLLSSSFCTRWISSNANPPKLVLFSSIGSVGMIVR